MNWFITFFRSLFGVATSALETHASATTQLVTAEAGSLISTTGAELVSNVLTKHGLDSNAVATATQDIVGGIADLVQGVGAPKAAATIAAIGNVAVPAAVTPAS